VLLIGMSGLGVTRTAAWTTAFLSSIHTPETTLILSSVPTSR
jgi:hypothetical protein